MAHCIKLFITGLLLALFYPVYSQHINPGVVLTFDDFTVSNWHKLLPIFEKYDARATFYITQPYEFNAEKQQMVLDLYEASNEIACHSYRHFNALNFTDTSDIETYITREILSSLQWFNTTLGIPLHTFSYPYGSRNDMLDNALLNYFTTIRGTSYSISDNINKIDKLSHSGLIFGVGIDEHYGYSLEQIKNELDRCKREGLIQVFYSHIPVDVVTGNLQIAYSKLDTILNYIHKLGLSFYTAQEVWLPIPPQPNGDTYIDMQTEWISDYSVACSPEYSLEWLLLPANAGNITLLDHAISVEWNNEFSGPATLQVASANRCGTGDYSDPLHINVGPHSTIIDHTCTNIHSIPQSYINTAPSLLHIAYETCSPWQSAYFRNVGYF